jgi:hypothetical protein
VTEDSGLQAWLVPVFVTAAIILVEAAAWLVISRRASAPATAGSSDRRIRTVALGMLMLLALAVAGMASLGPNLADQLASVIAALLGGVSAFLTYLSYKSSLDIRKNTEKQSSDTP